MRYLLIVAATLLLSACAGQEPYAEAKLLYGLPFSTDYWVHSDRSWQCEQPEFVGIVGMEADNGWAYGVEHRSFVLCGSGNKKPEIFSNHVFVSKKWGGK